MRAFSACGIKAVLLSTAVWAPEPCLAVSVDPGAASATTAHRLEMQAHSRAQTGDLESAARIPKTAAEFDEQIRAEILTERPRASGEI